MRYCEVNVYLRGSPNLNKGRLKALTLKHVEQARSAVEQERYAVDRELQIKAGALDVEQFANVDEDHRFWEVHRD
jgi:hypothetical protein